jgi:hypothetical protein
MVMRSLLRSSLFAVGALAALMPPATAQTGADFYKNKTVAYSVSTAPGGGYRQSQLNEC